MSLVINRLDMALSLEEHRQPPRFFLVQYVINEAQCGRVRARRILEREYPVVSDLLEQRKRLLKVGLGFSRKADNNVGRQTDRPPCRLDPTDPLQILLARVQPLH